MAYKEHKYKYLQDNFYPDQSFVIDPGNLMDMLNTKENEVDFGERFHVLGRSMADSFFTTWEWFSGSSSYSAVARDMAWKLLPPVDYRYGYDLAREADQRVLLRGLLHCHVQLLVAEPTCTPWSSWSSMWSADKRDSYRLKEIPVLWFLVLACLTQYILGDFFIIENGRWSAIFRSHH